MSTNDDDVDVSTTAFKLSTLKDDSTIPKERANAIHGLRSTSAKNDDYSNIGSISVPSAQASHVNTKSERAVSQVKILFPNALHAITGTSLGQQSSQFQQAVSILPSSLRSDIENYLADSDTSFALDMNATEHKATLLHTDKTGNLQAMEVTWGDVESSTIAIPFSHAQGAKSMPPPPPPPPPRPPPSSSLHQPSPSTASSLSSSSSSSSSSSDGTITVTALSGKPLSKQPKPFMDTVAALPQQVQDRLTELLANALNEVSVEMNAAAGTASVICKNGQRVSTLKASWDPGAWNPANWDPSQHSSKGIPSQPSHTQQTISTIGGTLYPSTPGKPLSRQSAAFQDMFVVLPAEVQGRIEDLLKDPQNEVSVDVNAAEGKANVICKNGLRISTLKSSWSVVYKTPDSNSQQESLSDGVSVQPNDTDITSTTASALGAIKVSNDSSSHSETMRANPKFGLRKV